LTAEQTHWGSKVTMSQVLGHPCQVFAQRPAGRGTTGPRRTAEAGVEDAGLSVGDQVGQIRTRQHGGLIDHDQHVITCSSPRSEARPAAAPGGWS
jgi:hypothetical protein